MQNARCILQLLTEKLPPGEPKKHSLTLPADNAPAGTVLQLNVWVDTRVLGTPNPLYTQHTFSLEPADLDVAPSVLVENVLGLLKHRNPSGKT